MSEIPDDIMQAATAIALPRHLTPRSQDLAQEICFAILHERQRHAKVMEEVRKVLEPFAASPYATVPLDVPSDMGICEGISIKDLRAARALLSQLEER